MEQEWIILIQNKWDIKLEGGEKDIKRPVGIRFVAGNFCKPYPFIATSVGQLEYLCVCLLPFASWHVVAWHLSLHLLAFHLFHSIENCLSSTKAWIDTRPASKFLYYEHMWQGIYMCRVGRRRWSNISTTRKSLWS